ncbi:MAG: DNA mismatch repair endonuclease MutL [Oscillospiraceae bacterium]|nr:DNA mismatch repair endonuclease MutL [Oscillospiraceae bacterium]
MPKVRLLKKELYELIAAGEVIERPSSIIKELTENSIDSGASAVTVEIKQGGISYMRVTDNGCGIAPEDVPTAFLRHATSKIESKDDLSDIHTLGFRGEALASVAAVARVDVMTKEKSARYGVHYVIEGTEEKLCEECGCPDGTTIVVRDIFYNVPARLKFLKKDVSEGNDIARIIEKIALSHPDVSIKFIRDNKQIMFTPGDNKLFSAVYSVLGREFASSLIPVEYSMNNVKITGFTVKPVFGMKNRKLQTFFVNGRYVQSFTCIRALEEAYKNSIMEGKFPACVLRLELSPATVDVNVHPQKIEVRFTEERAVYEAVYFAVKNAILSDSKPNEIELPKPRPNYNKPMFGEAASYVQTEIPSQPKAEKFSRIKAEDYAAAAGAAQPRAEKPMKNIPDRISAEDYRAIAAGKSLSSFKGNASPKSAAPIAPAPEMKAPPQPVPPKNIPEEGLPIEQLPPAPEPKEYKYINAESFDSRENAPEETNAPETPEYHREPVFRLIGEAFKTYIIAEMDDDIIFVDKHAAHERINFERMKSGEVDLKCQMMFDCPEVRLTYSQYDAVCENMQTITSLGFDIEPLTSPVIRVKGIPTILDVCDAADIAAELARNLDEHKHDPMPEILDDMLHSIACKASVRANDKSSPKELEAIVKRIFSDERIRYCPHGRPVMFKLTKRELEKQFKRIV